MIYRKLDATGDYTFGKASGNFFFNSSAAVAQAVLTRLKLFEGEWYLDITAGTPNNSKILGAGRISTYDAAIQEVILGTPGVLQITSYSSGVNPTTRNAQIQATINTVYGVISITQPV